MDAKPEKLSILTKTIPYRKVFHKATKKPTESPEKWLCRIKKLASLCDFGNCCGLFVLDKFITGLENEIIDYLKSCAECLDVDNSLEFIQMYEKQKYDSNDSISDNQINDPSTEPNVAVC